MQYPPNSGNLSHKQGVLKTCYWDTLLASELALGERSLGAARLALCQERSSTWTMPSAWFRPEADVLCQPWAQIFF